MTDQIGTTEARPDGFYWVMLGKNPPETTGSAASGGWPAIPTPGSQKR